MTLEPRMLAVEERLQRLASGMPSPDAEAGWAALSAQLEPPLAQVIPLRPKRFGRPIALAAAAALLVAGSALAAITRDGADRSAPAAAIAWSDGGVSSGPHLHEGFAGPPAAPSSSDDSADPATRRTHTPGSGGDAAQAGHDGKAHDDPNDRDQGTGNDGRHDDSGGGNDGAEGSSPGGHGHSGGKASAPSGSSTEHAQGGSDQADQAHVNAGGNGHGH
jgi:hypothetical protein